MRTISTEAYARIVGSKVAESRAAANLTERTKDILEEYGSPVTDELAEECLNTTFSLNSNDFHSETEMAKYAFAQVMLKWFGNTVNIDYDSYFNGEMIDVSSYDFESFRKATGNKCPNCGAPEIHGSGGGVECSDSCGYTECY